MFKKSLSKLLVAASLVLCIGNAWGITILVNSAVDEADDDTSDGVCATASGVCTLRAAVQTANRATGDNALIYLPEGTLTLTRKPQGNDDEQSGDLNITNTSVVVVIIGYGDYSDQTTIDASHLDRAFHVAPGATADINYLTIQNGSTTLSAVDGGAILNEGDLDLYETTLSDNSTLGNGGAIWNSGMLNVHYSTMVRNTSYVGGGIYNGDSASTRLDSSTVSQNFTQNGGGIFSTGNLTVINSTISGNSAHNLGGGICAIGPASNVYNIYNSTIAFNGADDDRDGEGEGGGVYVDSSVNFNIYNTIIAGNIVENLPVADDCVGNVKTHARNLFGSTAHCTITQISGSTGLLNSNALLGTLQNNGGSTETIALLPGSNAIDAGLPATGCLNDAPQLIYTDQRGFPRNVGGCDVGAFEYGSIDPHDKIFRNGFDGP